MACYLRRRFSCPVLAGYVTRDGAASSPHRCGTAWGTVRTGASRSTLCRRLALMLKSDEVVPPDAIRKRARSGKLEMQDASVPTCAVHRRPAGVTDERTHRQHVARHGKDCHRPFNAHALGFAGNSCMRPQWRCPCATASSRCGQGACRKTRHAPSQTLPPGRCKETTTGVRQAKRMIPLEWIRSDFEPHRRGLDWNALAPVRSRHETRDEKSTEDDSRLQGPAQQAANRIHAFAGANVLAIDLVDHVSSHPSW